MTLPIFPDAASDRAKLPLHGVKVLDLSRLLPGPYATLLLADLGADVLKIEDNQMGDYIRWGSPKIGEYSAGYMVLNRNKRSMTLNLKTAEGKEIFTKLVKEADVLIESFRPDVMARLGLGWEQLKEVNPGLIYCAISGYGQDGPYKFRPGHDLNYIGYAGVLGQTGAPEHPVLPGTQIADLGGGGLMSVVGILAALQGRQHTGQGRFVDISMTDAVVSWLTYHAGNYFATGKPGKRGEQRLTGAFPEYYVYETKDGKWLSVGALEPKFFARLTELIGLQEFNEVGTHGERADQIKAALTARFKEKTRDEWMALLGDEDVCVGPVYDIDEVMSDPQLVHRGMITEVEHPTAGKIKQIGLPIRFNDLETQDYIRHHPPGYGEDTADVLAALGYSAEEVTALREKKVV
jgi:crotonobetainyl-CoA:carnitine CoA-transferase CaiB-like acyl-CoA transferase